MTYVLVFLAAGLVVFGAAIVLSRSGDRIADGTGLGRVWIGSILLAGATSLPELATDVAAVRMDAADLAIGDLMGSGMANMLILAVIDLVITRRAVLRQAALDHALAMALATIMTALATVLILTRASTGIGGVSFGSLLLVAAYLAGTRTLFHHSRRSSAHAAEGTAPPAQPRIIDVRREKRRFALASLVILVAAPAFAWSAKGIATLTGLGNTFVGTFLVGLATSLPELVASIEAVRLGAVDLAVGNLFGSNAFNMLILLPLEVASPQTSIFANADPGHALTGLLTIVLMSLGLAAIVYRSERRWSLREPTSLFMLAVYAFAVAWLYSRAIAAGGVG